MVGSTATTKIHVIPTNAYEFPLNHSFHQMNQEDTYL
jgi:hypothetical protein